MLSIEKKILVKRMRGGLSIDLKIHFISRRLDFLFGSVHTIKVIAYIDLESRSSYRSRSRYLDLNGNVKTLITIDAIM